MSLLLVMVHVHMLDEELHIIMVYMQGREMGREDGMEWDRVGYDGDLVKMDASSNEWVGRMDSKRIRYLAWRVLY